MIDTLLTLGLTPAEALVFSALLEAGPCSVAPLVRRVKKHRQIIYNALEKLEKRHLITRSQKRGRNFYSIGDPKRLLLDLKQKEVLAERVAEDIEERQKTEQEQVDVYSGPQSYFYGLADLRMHAEEAGEFLIIGGEPKEWFEETKTFFHEHVEALKKLKHKGVPIMILFFKREREVAEEYIAPHLGRPYVCKIVKSDEHLPNTAWVAGSHTYLLTPTPDPLVVHVRSASLAEFIKKS